MTTSYRGEAMPKNIAILRCRIQPYTDQVERLEAFLAQKYG